MNPLELSDSFALYVHCDPSIKSVAWISDDHTDFEMWNRMVPDFSTAPFGVQSPVCRKVSGPENSSRPPDLLAVTSALSSHSER